MKVTSKLDLLDDFRVYIDDILHLKFRYNLTIGLQSWVENYRMYVVEIYFKDSEKIRLEYDNRPLWELILKEIDKNT